MEKTDTQLIQQPCNSQIIENETWFKSYWRPAAAWVYMLICLMDFVIFPFLSMILPAFLKGFGIVIEYNVWESLSLSSGGMIHFSFGAILGVAAWSRGQEKLADKK